jgi:hypothetical protein
MTKHRTTELRTTEHKKLNIKNTEHQTTPRSNAIDSVGAPESDGSGPLIGLDHQTPYLSKIKFGNNWEVSGGGVASEIIDRVAAAVTAPLDAKTLKSPLALAEISGHIK